MIVHLVTDRRRLASGQDARGIRLCLLRQAQYAIDAGVDVVQVREGDLETGALVDLTVAIVKMSRGSRTRVVVNDRVDVALAAGADGVHLPARGLHPSQVRRIVPAAFIVGRSVHSPAETKEAHGADYLIAGTLWASHSKPAGHRCMGIPGLEEVVRAASVPVLAIGGVTTSRAGEVAAAGAAGIAGIGLFAGEPTTGDCRAVPLVATVEALRIRFDSVRSGS